MASTSEGLWLFIFGILHYMLYSFQLSLDQGGGEAAASFL